MHGIISQVSFHQYSPVHWGAAFTGGLQGAGNGVLLHSGCNIYGAGPQYNNHFPQFGLAELVISVPYAFSKQSQYTKIGHDSIDLTGAVLLHTTQLSKIYYLNGEVIKIVTVNFNNELEGHCHSLATESNHLMPIKKKVRFQNQRGFVMEYYKQGDLENALKRCSKPISLDLCLKWMYQITFAVITLHKNNICHRDLKLKNIILKKNGDILLTDFGVSDYKGSPGSISGTVSHMPPEYAGNYTVDTEQDVWMLGCLFYQLITREELFPEEQILSRHFKRTTKQYIDSKLAKFEIHTFLLAILNGALKINPRERTSCNIIFALLHKKIYGSRGQKLK